MANRKEAESFRKIWDKHFEDYIKWVREHGGALPSASSSDKMEVALSSWMANNKARYKAGKLEPHRIDKLMGFNKLLLTGTKSDIAKSKFESRNSGNGSPEDSLLNKGLSKKALLELNSIEIYSVSDVINKLRRFDTLYNNDKKYGSEIDEMDRLVKALNLFSDTAVPLHSYKLLEEVFKRFNSRLSLGTGLILIQIEHGHLEYILFHNKYIFSNMTNRMNTALQTLTPREEKVMRLRFFDATADNRLTQAAAGKELGVIGGRLAQIERKSIRKLRHPKRLNYIKGMASRIPEI